MVLPVECNKSTRRAHNSGLCKLNAIHKNPDSIHGRFFVGSQYNGPHEIDRHAAFNRFTFVAFLYYPITPFIVFAFIILPGRRHCVPISFLQNRSTLFSMFTMDLHGFQFDAPR